MAISTGDIVSPRKGTNQICPPSTGPLFGTAVDVAAGAVDVQWDNGAYSTDIPEDQLDKIAFALPAYRYARLANAETPEYQGIVLGSYTRDTGGAGAATQYILMKLEPSGAYTEQLVANVTSVPGR